MAQSGPLALPEAVHQVIAREANSDHAAEILGATSRVSDRLVSHLEALIGTAGARALRQRSITLTGREHPWLVEVLSPTGTLLEPARVAGAEPLDPGLVMQSSVALLVNFVNLLVAFIGEHLTLQVLCKVWPDVAPLLRPKKELP